MAHFRYDRLIDERTKKGWTQDEVAKMIGVARSSYSNYENGNREPDFKIMNALSDIFDASIDYLTGRSNYKNEREILKELEGGRAYYGGADQYTEEEQMVADAAVEAYRKMKGIKKQKE